MIDVNGINNIKTIFSIFRFFSLAYKLRITSLRLKKQIYIKHYDYLKIFLDIFDKNCGKNWTSCNA